MARNRMIKPEFWSSEQVVSCSTSARLLFVGMWNFADDAGVQPDADLRLLMLVFPGDPFDVTDIHGWIDELEKAGLVQRYVVDGQGFTSITGWHHQKIDRPTFRYPPPPPESGASSTHHREVDESSIPTRTRTRTRNERNEKENEKENKNVRTYDRSVDRSCLDGVDSETVVDRCRLIHKRISEQKGPQEMEGPHPIGDRGAWDMPKDFALKLGAAARIVEAGIIPARWLEDVITMFLESTKKRPGGWLGKVLASTAKEHYGVDFDSFKRQIKTPEVT